MSCFFDYNFVAKKPSCSWRKALQNTLVQEGNLTTLLFLYFSRVAVKKFDDKLMELYKMRLRIEKCILAEELKILLHDRQMSVQDQVSISPTF
jgi:hypothetical protein